MANTELDAFLAAPEPAPAPQPTEAPPAPPPAAPASPPATTPEPAEDDADEPGERIEREGQSYIPHQTLERERQRRQDWKERALKGETRAIDLQKQLEELKAAARPAPPPAPPPRQVIPINPAEDPIGFAQQQAREAVNNRLNGSEMMLRDKIGDAVDGYVAEFRELAANDRTLWDKLYSHVHPYYWMQQEVERHRAMREVGTDLKVYNDKIIAAARAEWEKEHPAAVAPSNVVNMQPSLAGARSVAGRTSQAWTGEASLEDIISPIQNRRGNKGNGGIRF